MFQVRLLVLDSNLKEKPMLCTVADNVRQTHFELSHWDSYHVRIFSLPIHLQVSKIENK